MSSELVISSTPQGDKIALLQDRRLVEYHFESVAQNYTVGDIYLGTVKKLSPALNAAFVDVGYDKDAFLHYHDLGPQFNTLLSFTKQALAGKLNTVKLAGFKSSDDIDKNGKMAEVITKNQQILVQIEKEPISNKGPRLTSEISLAGRYLVLVPFGDSISISKKIQAREERNRLTKLLQGIKPKGYGVIIRTVAENHSSEELSADLRSLVERWEEGMKRLPKAKPREKIIGELGRASSIMRDMLNESFDSIITDSKETYDELRNYVRTIAPEKEKIVKLHNAKTKLFEQSGVEKQLKTLFGKTVALPSGGYLIIEHTEALHVIDVNSGNSKNSEGQETTALAVNCEAAKEIARQLRLRDMGGIIVVDFIDMRSTENRRKLYEVMKQEMAGERAKFTILPLSKFGLMEITRQRVRPEINVSTHEVCPSCGGTGKINATVAVADMLEQTVDFVSGKQNEKNITIMTHPFVHAYFTKGMFNKLWQWRIKYSSWNMKMMPDSSLGITEFKIVNKEGEEIDLTRN